LGLLLAAASAVAIAVSNSLVSIASPPCVHFDLPPDGAESPGGVCFSSEWAIAVCDFSELLFLAGEVLSVTWTGLAALLHPAAAKRKNVRM
jgi:hypothetical protein